MPACLDEQDERACPPVEAHVGCEQGGVVHCRRVVHAHVALDGLHAVADLPHITYIDRHETVSTRCEV